MYAPKDKSAIVVKTTKNVCVNNQFLRFNGLMKPTTAIKNETTTKPPIANPPKKIDLK
jgi:hypothetical protein